MGKRAKGKRAEERKRQRKAEHTAKKAKYEAFAREGRRKGTRRAKRKVGFKLVTRIKHPMPNCGNPGCKRCYPQFATKKLVKAA